jgi:hypothetical protein
MLRDTSKIFSGSEMAWDHSQVCQNKYGNSVSQPGAKSAQLRIHQDFAEPRVEFQRSVNAGIQNLQIDRTSKSCGV